MLRTIDILTSNKESISGFINILNRNRIILDEGEYKCDIITSTFMEKWDEDCTKFLIESGYNNSTATIECAAVYFNYWGAVYALFDDDYYSYEEARKYISDYVAKSNLEN